MRWMNPELKTRQIKKLRRLYELTALQLNHNHHSIHWLVDSNKALPKFVKWQRQRTAVPYQVFIRINRD